MARSPAAPRRPPPGFGAGGCRRPQVKRVSIVGLLGDYPQLYFSQTCQSPPSLEGSPQGPKYPTIEVVEFTNYF